MSSVNSMVQFRTFFGINIDGDNKTSLLFVSRFYRTQPFAHSKGIYTVGTVCSFFGASIIPDQLGRRYGMLIGNTILIVGALISGLAHNFGMLLGGRFMTGFGGGIANNSSKSYLTEITPPTTRGRWMGLLNSFYYGKRTIRDVCWLLTFSRPNSGNRYFYPIRQATLQYFVLASPYPRPDRSGDNQRRIHHVLTRVAALAVLKRSTRTSGPDLGKVSF